MSRPLLIIDGDCGVCRASAGWLQRHGAQALVIANRDHRLPPSVRRVAERMVMLHEHGVLRGGGRAALRACARLSWPWRLLACALGLPSVPREAVYGMIARHRSLLSRACGLHPTAPMCRTALRPDDHQGAEERP